MGSHHHDLYDRRRKGSVDSYRSHRSRSRSADSYGRRHRSRSVDDRFRKDSLRDQLPALETLTEAPDKTDPPTYDESQADAQSGDSEKGKQGGAQKKELALWWSFAPLLPLLIGLFLLFIVTCSASRLRADFALIKIQLDAEDYSALYTATLDQQTRRKRDAAGYLTLGTWGWCVKSADSRQTSCSRTSGWYSMDQLLDNTNSGLSSDDFNSFLVHLLILHGLALLITLLAVVPVSLSAWRQYRRDTNSQPGWFQHGTILASASLALVAWTIDKILKHSVASNANAYTVESGLGEAFTGGASLCLYIAFALSAIPLMCRFIRTKHEWAATHGELQNATVLEEEESAKMRAEEEEARRRKREERRDRRGRRDRRRHRWRTYFEYR